EARRDDGVSAMTVTAYGLPTARIALGADPDNPRGPYPTVHTIYQQLHNYPVGPSGKARKKDAKGSKYNITPVRREFLADLRAIVALDFGENEEHPDVEGRIRRALDREQPESRRGYGLPFLGDNAFLIDKIEACDEPRAALWYRRLKPEGGTMPSSTRL